MYTFRFTLLGAVVSLLTLCTSSLKGQVNAYAGVTNINGAVLSIGQTDERFDSFEDGDYVLLLQMQDSVVAGSASSGANFGKLGSIENAGHYELCRIVAHTESAGEPTSITLAATPNYMYNIRPNARVQLITFPTLGNPNYTTTSSIQAVSWNGQIGGVVAFRVDGQLTLLHDIDVTGQGFRGGVRSPSNSSGGCDPTALVSGSTRYGYKGEGLHHNTWTNAISGMAPVLSGGGGGSTHNGGGGGGSNITAGGNGGAGWRGGSNTGCTPRVGGDGGYELYTAASNTRLFMGGGGGGGEQNNSRGGNGGAGGGLILVRAQTLHVPTSSTSSILADGGMGQNAGNDGAGGGGAGGSILLDVATYNIQGNLRISSNGGDGGNVITGNVHAGGGGGGQGAVYLNREDPTVYAGVQVETIPGTGGCDNTACVRSASSGAGLDNEGVFKSSAALLRVQLIEFSAQPKEQFVELHWKVKQIDPTAPYIIERSIDGVAWAKWQEVTPQPILDEELHYTVYDENPFDGYTYYRLRFIDAQGQWTYSPVRVVQMADGQHFVVYPQPSNGLLNIRWEQPLNTTLYIDIIDATGRVQAQNKTAMNAQNIQLNMSHLPAGIYMIRLRYDGQQRYRKWLKN